MIRHVISVVSLFIFISCAKQDDSDLLKKDGASATGAKNAALEVVEGKFVKNLATSGFFCPAGTEIYKLKADIVKGDYQVLMCGFTSTDERHTGTNKLRGKGPFPDSIREQCKKNAGKDSSASCDADNYTLSYVFGLRGNGYCPNGTQADSSLGMSSQAGVCIGKLEGKEMAFGPFPTLLIEHCKSVAGSRAGECDTSLVWEKSWFPKRPITSITEQLADFYSNPVSAFGRVYANLLSWFGTTHMACAATVVTALNAIGVKGIPALDSEINKPTLTYVLESVLLKAPGWKRFTNQDLLVPGSLIFTNLNAAGQAEHVMVFMGWADKAGRVAKVVDNQSSLANPIHARTYIWGFGILHDPK